MDEYQILVLKALATLIDQNNMMAQQGTPPIALARRSQWEATQKVIADAVQKAEEIAAKNAASFGKR